jgi:hypothetical protein
MTRVAQACEPTVTILVAILVGLLNLAGPAIAGVADLHNQKIARNPLRAALSGPTDALRASQSWYQV